MGHRNNLIVHADDLVHLKYRLIGKGLTLVQSNEILFIKNVLLKCEEHRILVRIKDLKHIKILLSGKYHLLDEDYTQLDDLDIQHKLDQLQEPNDCE